MKKEQLIKAVLHLPSTPHAIESLQRKMSDFYIRQVEIQIGKYDITKEQQQQVLRKLVQEYRPKA